MDFFYFSLESTSYNFIQTIETTVIQVAITLIMTSLYCTSKGKRMKAVQAMCSAIKSKLCMLSLKVGKGLDRQLCKLCHDKTHRSRLMLI